MGAPSQGSVVGVAENPIWWHHLLEALRLFVAVKPILFGGELGTSGSELVMMIRNWVYSVCRIKKSTYFVRYVQLHCTLFVIDY